MPRVNLEEAQTRLSELIASLLPGEELVITDNDVPVAKLLRVPPKDQSCQPGSAKGKILFMAEDFDAPLEDFKEYM